MPRHRRQRERSSVTVGFSYYLSKSNRLISIRTRTVGAEIHNDVAVLRRVPCSSSHRLRASPANPRDLKAASQALWEMLARPRPDATMRVTHCRKCRRQHSAPVQEDSFCHRGGAGIYTVAVRRRLARSTGHGPNRLTGGRKSQRYGVIPPLKCLRGQRAMTIIAHYWVSLITAARLND